MDLITQDFMTVQETPVSTVTKDLNLPEDLVDSLENTKSNQKNVGTSKLNDTKPSLINQTYPCFVFGRSIKTP